MGTRAVMTIIGEDQKFHLYKMFDGYESGIVPLLQNTSKSLRESDGFYTAPLISRQADYFMFQLIFRYRLDRLHRNMKMIEETKAMMKRTGNKSDLPPLMSLTGEAEFGIKKSLREVPEWAHRYKVNLKDRTITYYRYNFDKDKDEKVVRNLDEITDPKEFLE